MDFVTQVSISLESALAAGTAAIKRAKELDVRIAVTVMDPSGAALVQLRMPGTPLHSVQIAFDKAYTAVSFGRNTRAWQAILEQRSEAVRAGLMKQPHFLTMAGGVLVSLDGNKVGAIGISGASEGVDEDCARAGLQAILCDDSGD
jgi:uncharacterized protein GlcG (DUF336 family)